QDLDDYTISEIENPIDKLLDQLRTEFHPLRFEYWIPYKNRTPYSQDKFDPRT
ncbi:4812_t:CDS:1, partial [Racocetra persica]